jgi:L-threonylcarbamoyladenylate synthase
MIIVSEDISKAAEILNEENLVAIPTETVYGLAGNICSDKSHFEMKQRPFLIR